LRLRAFGICQTAHFDSLQVDKDGLLRQQASLLDAWITED
jgi:hypothetical protein